MTELLNELWDMQRPTRGPGPVLRIDSFGDAAGRAGRDRQHTQHSIVAVSLPQNLVYPR